MTTTTPALSVPKRLNQPGTHLHRTRRELHGDADPLPVARRLLDCFQRAAEVARHDVRSLGDFLCGSALAGGRCRLRRVVLRLGLGIGAESC